MPQETPPQADDALLAWSLTVKTKSALSPSTYGLDAADATAYGLKHDAFASAMAVISDPATRSPANTYLKNQKKAELVAAARQIGRQMNGDPAVTSSAKLELGYNPHDTIPTPSPVPAFAPGLTVRSVTGRTLRIKLNNTQEPDSRAKPPYVGFATVLSYVGDEQPESIDAFKFEGNSTRTLFDIVLPDSVPSGATVWLIAYWNNTRGINGPACAPVKATITGGTVNVQANLKFVPQTKKAA